MEKVGYMVLGAALALLGGIVTQVFQNFFNRRKEDEALLFQAMINLHDHYPIEKLKSDWRKEVGLRNDLMRITIRIQSRHYRGLAVDLNKFAVEDIFRTEEELGELTIKVQKALNKPLIEKYEKTMEEMRKEIREQAEK